jgi:hypothetical protein
MSEPEWSREAGPLPPLVIEGRHGWVDLTFHIVRRRRDDDLVLFRVGARHADRDVGFDLAIDAKWEIEQLTSMRLTDSGTLAKDELSKMKMSAYAGGGAFAATQDCGWGDAFVQAAAALYGVAVVPRTMGPVTEFNALSLTRDPARVFDEPLDLKIFFGSHPDFGVPYSEAFLNFNVPAGTIQLHEKDPEYRGAIIEALTRGTDPPPESSSDR